METPRKRISGNLFGSEPKALFSTIWKEGSILDNDFNIFRFPAAFNSSRVTFTAAPVKLSFGLLNIPVTTTSSMEVTSSSITTFKGLRSFTVTTFFFIPTKENTSLVSGASGTEIENFPLISVVTPTVVPSRIIVTPGKEFPTLSFTIPE